MLSSIGATASLPLGRYHCECEEWIEQSGLAWTFLRPGFFIANALTRCSGRGPSRPRARVDADPGWTGRADRAATSPRSPLALVAPGSIIGLARLTVAEKHANKSGGGIFVFTDVDNILISLQLVWLVKVYLVHSLPSSQKEIVGSTWDYTGQAP